MRKLLLAVLFSVAVAVPVKADGLGFVVNGGIAAWGWYTLSKCENGQVYVGVTASVFTIRSIIELFK